MENDFWIDNFQEINEMLCLAMPLSLWNVSSLSYIPENTVSEAVNET